MFILLDVADDFHFSMYITKRDETVIKNVRDGLLKEAIENFITSVHTLNIPLEELIPLVKENYEKELENRRE